MVGGTDGKTAYERLKGKRHHGEFVRFCSRVMYRVQGKVQGGIMTERWFEGIWLMKRFHTEEHVVADLQNGKVVRARSIRKIPQEITAVDLRRVIGKPWAPSGNFDEGEDVKRGLLPVEEVLPERMDNAPRAVKFTNQILEAFGFSENCPSCLAKVNGTTFTGPHSEACRTRTEDLMMSSENDLWRQKVLLSRKKRDRYLEAELDRAEQIMKKHPEVKFEKASSSTDKAVLVEPVVVPVPAVVEPKEDVKNTKRSLEVAENAGGEVPMEAAVVDEDEDMVLGDLVGAPAVEERPAIPAKRRRLNFLSTKEAVGDAVVSLFDVKADFGDEATRKCILRETGIVKPSVTYLQLGLF